MNIKIDPEFRDKIPPLSQDEFSKLEENILADGEVREPIVVWDDTIVDGHHRWKIIQKHPEIPYKVKQMSFPDKYAAIVWMCKNQIGRRNISDLQKDVLLAEAQKAGKLTKGGERGTGRDASGRFTAKRQNGALRESKKTSKRIAEEFGVGYRTVERAVQFLDGLNAADEAGVLVDFKNSRVPGRCVATSTLFKTYKVMNRDDFVDMLRMIRQAWPDDEDGLSNQIICGLRRFYMTYKGQFRRNDLLKTLKGYTPSTIIREGRGAIGAKDLVHARVILRFYNKGRTSKRLEDVI